MIPPFPPRDENPAAKPVTPTRRPAAARPEVTPRPSLWSPNDRLVRRNLTAGFLLFAGGILLAALGRHGEMIGMIIPGWVAIFVGLFLFVCGLAQSPINRR